MKNTGFNSFKNTSGKTNYRNNLTNAINSQNWSKKTTVTGSNSSDLSFFSSLFNSLSLFPHLSSLSSSHHVCLSLLSLFSLSFLSLLSHGLSLLSLLSDVCLTSLSALRCLSHFSLCSQMSVSLLISISSLSLFSFTSHFFTSLSLFFFLLLCLSSLSFSCQLSRSLFTVTMTVITGPVSSLCALSGRVHGLRPFHCLAKNSIGTTVFKYICSRVPLEIKWACTFAGDGDVFTCVTVCGWSTVCHVVGVERGVVVVVWWRLFAKGYQQFTMNPQEHNRSWKGSAMCLLLGVGVVWLFLLLLSVAGFLLCCGLFFVVW